jgi:8-oxo-dGTP diphosphatase
MAREPINAAGGIVMRGGTRPRIAVVRRSKDDRWVLPRGKLKRDENPIAGAKREVVEETGHRVKVHEFLGAITYSARGRPKLVQFWRMLAAERPSYDITEDITEVRWLPLGAAIRRLSFPLEKLFLRSIGRRALKRRHRRKPRRKSARSAPRVRRAAARKKSAAKRSRKKRHAAPVATVRPAAVPPNIFRRLLGRAVTLH